MIVKLIPADDRKPIELVDLAEKYPDKDPIAAAGSLIGGFIALTRTRDLLARRQVMLVDEDGLAKENMVNIRAQRETRYPHILVGDVLLCGERHTRLGQPTGHLLDYPR